MSEEIHRYDWSCYNSHECEGCIDKRDDGEFVRYEEHKTIVDVLSLSANDAAKVLLDVLDTINEGEPPCSCVYDECCCDIEEFKREVAVWKAVREKRIAADQLCRSKP